MKRTLSAIAVAAAAFASAQAQAVEPSFVDYPPVTIEATHPADATVRAALPQPSFVDYTVLPTEQATQPAVISSRQLLAGFPQPSSIAN